MPLPLERVSLSARQVSVILPGLEAVLNGIAGARLDHYPHRNPADRVDPELSKVHESRAFDEAMAARILSMRNKLKSLGRSRKLRLDAFDLAATAFAVRFGQREQLMEAPAEDVAKLLARLEKFRKRTKRAAISEVGKLAYDEEAIRWRRFASWLRYNLCYFHLPRPKTYGLKRTYQMHFEQVLALTGEALTSNGYAVLPPDQLRRIAKLAMAELRRGRHPGLTVLEILRNREKGLEFLFRFIQKRIDLFYHEVVDRQLLPLCHRMSIVGEMIERCKIIEG